MISLLSFRCDAAIVINNIFQVFDSGNSGKIIPRDLLVAFTMAMKGTGVIYIMSKMPLEHIFS